MKDSQRRHVWHKLQNEEFTVGLKSAYTGFIRGFHGSKVDLAPGLAIFCGINSSGKTRLLNGLYNATTAAINGTFDATLGSIEFDVTPPQEVVYIDTYWLLQRQHASLTSDEALQDRIDQAGLSSFKNTDLKIAAYLLGRDYNDIKVAELDSTDESNALSGIYQADERSRAASDFRAEVVPYFEVVRRNGQKFSSLELSQGELAGLTLIWSLANLSKNSLVMIDEPESFLSPNATQGLFDVIAHYAVDKKSHCLVSTHAAIGIFEVPLKKVLVLNTNLAGETMIEKATRRNLWNSLRLTPPHGIVFFVEDRAASEWLADLLADSDYEYRDVTAIWIGNGESNIMPVSRFPSSDQADISVWAVFDGDQKNSHNSRPGPQSLFLPGDKAPEDIIVDHLMRSTAAQYDMNQDLINEALVITEGVEVHNRVQKIAEHLHMPVATFRRNVLRDWERTDVGALEVSEFKDSLRKVSMIFPASR